MNDPELIPCDDELERLKEFLTKFKRPTGWVTERQDIEWKAKWRAYDERLPDTLEKLIKPSERFIRLGRQLLAENRQSWIDSVKGGPFPKEI